MHSFFLLPLLHPLLPFPYSPSSYLLILVNLSFTYSFTAYSPSLSRLILVNFSFFLLLNPLLPFPYSSNSPLFPSIHSFISTAQSLLFTPSQYLSFSPSNIYPFPFNCPSLHSYTLFLHSSPPFPFPSIPLLHAPTLS